MQHILQNYPRSKAISCHRSNSLQPFILEKNSLKLYGGMYISFWVVLFLLPWKLIHLEKSYFFNEKPFFIVIREQNSSEHWKKKESWRQTTIWETSMWSILNLVFGLLTFLLKSLVIPAIWLALTGSIYSNRIISCSKPHLFPR